MKYGNDMSNFSNDLKCFFETAVRCNTTIQKTNEIQWIIIFEEKNEKERLGISREGQWVFRDERRFFVLKEGKMFLYCVKLLEIPYGEIEKKLEERFKEIVRKEKMCVSSIFLFFQIVEFAFSNLRNDYWFDLAWSWYENLAPYERHKLVRHLEEISEVRKISQRNRQKAKKEVAKMLIHPCIH